MSLAEEFTAARVASGLSHRALAQRLNQKLPGRHASAGSVSNILNGHYHKVSAETIVALADILGGDPVRWCALSGCTHPVVAEAIRDPERARRLYRSARRNQAIRRPCSQPQADAQ